MSGEQVDVDLLRQEGQSWLSNFGDDWPGLLAAADEIVRLRDWKTEAMLVLGQWDRVYEALGSPGPLGTRKSEASLAEVARHRALVAELRLHGIGLVLLARHGFGGDE